MNRRIFFRAFIVTVLIYFLVFLGVGYYFSEVALRPDNRRGTSQYVSDYERGWFDPAEYESWSADTFDVAGAFDYDLECTWLPMDSAVGTVVLVHGFKMDRWSMVKYVPLWKNLGFNVLLYDHRFHGMTEGAFVSYGYLEREDLDHVVAWARSQSPKLPIGIHGESMGAATTMLYASWKHRQQEIQFAIEDCGYSDLGAEFKYQLKADFGLPDWGVTHWANRMSRWRYGFDFRNVEPRQELVNCDVPMLFIHGDADFFVPTEMVYENFEAHPGPKALYLAPGSGHASAVLDHTEDYEKQLEQFLNSL